MKKGATGQSFIWKEITSYRIVTLSCLLLVRSQISTLWSSLTTVSVLQASTSTKVYIKIQQKNPISEGEKRILSIEDLC